MREVLGDSLEARRERAIVVLAAKIGDQRLRVLAGYDLRTVTDGFPLRPPSGREQTLEIVECLLRYSDLEGNNVLRRCGKHQLRSVLGGPVRSQRPKARWEDAGKTGCGGRTYELTA